MTDVEDAMRSEAAHADASPTDHRRRFFAALGALVAGAVTLLVPLAAGIVAFLAPLMRKNSSTEVRVALLEQVPDDGRPRYFPVVTDRTDAWNRYTEERIGAVYLVRQEGEETPKALSAKCPHAGCFIGYTNGDELFRCPCHTSAFQLDGSRAHGDAEVSPRDMDALPVRLRPVVAADGSGGVEVWVEYIDFQTGHKHAIPTA